MKNSKIKIMSIILLTTLTSCNAYSGELISKNTNEFISYVNEFRINSGYDYLIPLESTSSLSKSDIKSIKLDENNIDNYELEKMNESSYKYYLKINSQNTYKKLNVTLKNNKEYVYFLNLMNYKEELYNEEYTFKVIDCSVFEDTIYNYKISYMLNFNNDISLLLDNSLNINHPLFKGSAKLVNMDEEKESYSTITKAYLSKNTNYLLTISFQEDSSCYYFDEFIPFKIETKVNYDFTNYYIVPKYESNLSSKILSKIF